MNEVLLVLVMHCNIPVAAFFIAPTETHMLAVHYEVIDKTDRKEWLDRYDRLEAEGAEVRKLEVAPTIPETCKVSA